MKDKYIFYRLNKKSNNQEWKLPEDYNVIIFKPKLLKLSLHSNFKLIYLFWYIFTFAKYIIYYVINNEKEIIHYSFVMPKIFKYTFMPRRNCIHIGPCWTSEKHRGISIYPFILNKICNDNANKGIYIFTEKDNISSQKGIIKAGFNSYGIGYKSKFIGIYKLLK